MHLQSRNLRRAIARVMPPQANGAWCASARPHAPGGSATRLRARAGFTLVEVLTALGIFAIAVLGLLVAMHTTMDAAGTADRDAWVRLHLESRLASLLARKPKLYEAESAPDERGVRYLEQVVREEMVNSEKTVLRGFSRVRVTAIWTQDGSEQQWQASVLAYDP